MYLTQLGSMTIDSTAAEALLEQWEGRVVPRSFNAGFVKLSYVVSLIGAASTLELINRRTAPKGNLNQYVVQILRLCFGTSADTRLPKACCSSAQP